MLCFGVPAGCRKEKNGAPTDVVAVRILHGVAFWKELMARKKHAWRASLPQDPCARCGYTSAPSASSAQQQPATEPAGNVQPNVYPYAGPSADFRETNVLTPERSSSSDESAMEEGLLLGSDFEGGYQTISREEDTVVEQPEGVVVGKGKKGKGKAKEKKQRSDVRHVGDGAGEEVEGRMGK